MKKSQTLAALALAFALGLGVVAPVANTYAAYTADYTEAQTKEMDSIVAYANVLTASTKNLNDYITIYNKIETATTGVRAKLNKVVADALKQFNDGPAKADSDINTKIRDALLYTSAAFDAQNLKDAITEQATPVALPTISAASDLKAAYDSLKNLITKVEFNIDLLTKNYDPAATDVIALQGKYTDVKNEAWGRINDIEDKIDEFTTGTSSLNAQFTAIDSEGFAEVKASDAWKDAENNSKTQYAIQWGLLIDFAESLPKYNLVAPVVNAEVNYDRVIDPVQVVDYAHAQSYTSAYINAVLAFRGEAADPTNPEVSASVRTLASGDVTVVAYLPNNVELVVKNENTNVFGDKAHKAYDISFTQNGTPYTFSGTAVVTIKTGSLDASKTSAYYVEGNNSSALTTVRNADSVSFTATHFSVYAIVEDGKTQVVDGIGGTDDDPSAPGTGIVSSAEGNAATTVSIVAGLATALTALGAGVVAYRSARRSNK